jgi:hypothetical protein
VEIQRSFRSRESEAPSGQYRLYFLDSASEDQLISDSFEFEAGSDGAALEVVESMREGRPAELWRGTKRLKAWSAQH